jgi:hypothetical protein
MDTMGRRLLLWLAALLLSASCWLPVSRVHGADEDSNKPDNTERIPILPYVFGAVALGIILLIVSKPSRKS